MLRFPGAYEASCFYSRGDSKQAKALKVQLRRSSEPVDTCFQIGIIPGLSQSIGRNMFNCSSVLNCDPNLPYCSKGTPGVCFVWKFLTKPHSMEPRRALPGAPKGVWHARCRHGRMSMQRRGSKRCPTNCRRSLDTSVRFLGTVFCFIVS